MTHFLYYLLDIMGVVVSLVFLIGFHEWGHAITAQKLGFDVERFAIGFGKIIWSKTSSKSNIQYAICLFPLGGYVKFRDQTQFDNAQIYRRAAVIFAGPFFNLIFAFIAYWSVFFMGITNMIPVIEKTLPQSLAEKNHLLPQHIITAIDHHPVQTWPAVIFRLIPHIGNFNDKIIFSLAPTTNPLNSQDYYLSLHHWKLDPLKPDLLTSLGIISLKDAPLIHRKFNALQSGLKSFQEIGLYINLNGIILMKLIEGDISLHALAGPLGLLSTTFTAIHQGPVIFFAFLGFLSIGLAFTNLLPIPGLDGSHLLYLIIEKIRGKPLSIRLQMLLLRLGIIFIYVIMFQAFMNDLLRLS